MDRASEISAKAHDDGFMQDCLQSVYRELSSDRNQEHVHEVGKASANFIKTGALYVPGGWGKVVSAAVFAADEIKPSEPNQLGTDVILGASKGLMLARLNQFGGQRCLPAGQGALLGLGSRATDVCLSRSTYEQPTDHKFDLSFGVHNIAAEIGDTRAFVADAAMYGGARILMPSTASYLRNPHQAATISGATFGLMSGAVSEVQRQQSNNERLDYGKILRSAGISAAIDGTAAQLGNSFARQCRNPREFATAPTHSYSDGDRALLYKFDHRLNRGEMKDVEAALENISNRVSLGELHPSTADHIYSRIHNLFKPAELLPQVQSDGARIGKQLLMQVGNPRLVQQGDNPTCSVAALEHRLFTKEPQQAVDLVLQAVTTATYKPPFPYRGERFQVKLNPQTLLREMPTANPYDIRHNGMYRSHVSQIMQYVIPNVHWQSPREGSQYERNERLRHYFVVDRKTMPPTMHDFPHLSSSETQDIYEAITGSGQQFHFNGHNFRNLADFKAILQQTAKDNRLPLLLTVDARRAPFTTAHQRLSGHEINPQQPSAHDICLTRYDQKSGLVFLHNPWGRQAHPYGIPVEVLYNSLYRNP